jgi:uncharacterized protein (TIGR02266 family)
MAISSESETPRTEGRRARQYQRLPLTVEVDVSSANTFWTGLTRNVSRGGLFLEAEEPLPIGTTLAFTLRVDTLPADTEVRGVVRWVRADCGDDELPPGMGIQFVGLAPHVEEAIERFIDELRESLYYDTDEDV